MKTIEFAYDVGDEVKIKTVGLWGTIDSMSFDSLGKQYRIVFWANSARSTVWMYDWEIEATKK